MFDRLQLPLTLPLSAPPAVYLGVTNLSAYQARMTGLCAQWQPQRHAGAYRVVVESLLSEYTPSSAILSWISFSPSRQSEGHTAPSAVDTWGVS